MNISIVIPNYNGEHLLRKNLGKVIDASMRYIKQKGDRVDVIIVDDGSRDESKKFIKYQISNLKESDKLSIVLFENKKNKGFSSTVNKGVRNAKGDIVVLLNTDVEPEKDFLMPLVEHFKNEKVFAVGCLDKSIEKTGVVLRGRGIGKWQRGFLVHSKGEIDKSDTLWVSGGSGAFKRSIWDKLGGFDQLYNPFYWEDIDLSYRALKSGYQIIFEPKSIVVHQHEQGSIKRKHSPFQIKIIAYRNQFIFVWKNATDLSLQFSYVAWLPYRFAKAFISKDWAFFIGFFLALMILPKVIKSKFEVRKDFIKTDGQVMEMFKE